ncbi:PepSY domain-containing protein [Jeotgalibacillus terrae]|uniref:PepSY domain-containing protein n=1 Tax=Jeotgalibacillus terrae TaxID=587735 RepID=A0ABW5ZEK1_9BACL|nr:putative membrane protein YkoI [Jeotgalibacillus terrae]
MKKQRFIWMTGGALLAVVLIVLVQQFMTSGTQAAPMTQEEALQLIDERYPGHAAELIEEDGNLFVFNLENESGRYSLEIDRESNSVSHLENISINDSVEAQETAELTEEEALEAARKSSEGKIVSSGLSESADGKQYEFVFEEESRIVTIAVNTESGQAEIIDEEQKETDIEEPARILTEKEAIGIALEAVSGEVDDIELEQTDGVPYFIVEIETEDNEASVQINAISGQVMSTYWDD